MTSVKLPKLLLGLLLVCSTLINAQTLTISDSGETGTSGTNWSTAGSNPVIITATGNASVNTSVIEGYLNTGTSLLLEGSVINIASAIDKTAGGDATLTIRGGGTNTMGFGRAMINADVQSTSGALNIVLWSDYNNHNRAGSTVSGSPTINTNGGHFWVGGSASAQGSTTWNGLTVGDGPSVNAVGATNQNSVDIAGLALNTGGGDTFIWAAPGAGNGTQGINFTTTTINAATGDIILVADVLNGASTLTSTGHLYLVPDGGAYPSVVTWSHNNASTNIDVSGTFDALTINAFSSLGGLIIGKYDGMTGASITNSSAVQVSSPIEIAGPITIEGSAVTVNHDIITSTASDITLSATNGFSSGTSTRRNITSANGNILIEADADASGAGTLDIDYLTFNAGSGDLTLRSELLQWLTTTDAIKPWINGTGAFVLESNDASLGQQVETEWFNIDQDGNSYSELRLGKATNTQDITINTAQDVAGPIAIYGENIFLNQNMNTNAANGDILIQGETSIQANNSDRTLNSGSGDITLITNNLINTASKVIIQSTGTFTIKPFGSAFSSYGGEFGLGGTLTSGNFIGSSDANGLRINNVSQLTGLVIGKEGITTGFRTFTDWTINGPISFLGDFMRVSGGNIISTASNEAIIFKVLEEITIEENRSIQANNGDIILWADSDADGGFITVNEGVTINTQGGDLVLAGGADDGSNGGISSDGIPDDFAWRKTNDPDFGGVSLGEGATSGTALISLLSNGGNILVRGKSSDASFHPGILSQDALLIDSGTGTISINGTSTTNHGIELAYASTAHNIAIRSASNTETAISIEGMTTANAGGFFLLGTGSSIIQSEGTGAVNITGNSTIHEGLIIDNTQILSASGKITLTGTGPNNGHLLRNTDIGLRSSATAIQGITPLAASSADIDLIANSIQFLTASNTIASTGVLHILPIGDAFSSDLTVGSFFDPGTTLTGLEIGKNHATAANVTLESVMTIAGPITVYGGDIEIDANITTTATSGTGVLIAGRKITQNNNSDVITSGANIDYQATNFLATSSTDYVIALDGSSGDKAVLQANGGDIKLNATFGIGGNTGGADRGIYLNDAELLTDGAGAILLTGDATNNLNTTTSAWGSQLFNTRIQNEDGAVTLTMTGGKANSNSRGFVIDNSTVSILSSSGSITINDLKANGLTGTHTGLYLKPSSANAIKLGADGVNVLNSNAPVTITTNRFTFDAQPTHINSSGELTIQPFGDDFDNAVAITNLNTTDISNLTIGKSGTSADGTDDITTTLSGAIAANGPISVYSGDLAINAATTATNSDINLYASGAVTQSAALTANRLSLNGTGTFTLQNTANNVGTIAGGDATTRLGNVAYRDANTLEIGSINTDGIFSSATILIETETENLTLSEHINTTSNSDDAIILNAGKTAAAGTATGGDIIVSGTPTLTYGSGGRAKLFSGSASNSTGLTTLVGGDVNVRTGFDENSTISPALADDNAYAIYRVATGTGDLTIVSSGGDAENSTWRYINGVIETLSASANILNTDVETKFANGDLTIEANKVSFSANITNTTSNAFKVLSKTHIENTNATTITTQGGAVLFASNVDDASDGESSINGNINFRNGLTIATNGGAITLGGGDTSGSNYAVGRADIDETTEGIRIDNILNIDSGGGAIVIRGKSSNRDMGITGYGNSGFGVYALNSAGIINSGIGTINIDGINENPNFTDYSSGIVFALNNDYKVTIQSASTATNAISISAFATGPNSENYGIEIKENSPLSILATGNNGGITIRSGQSSTASNAYDLIARSTLEVLANSGPIHLTSLEGGSENGILHFTQNPYFGSRSGSAITSSSADIVIQYDRLLWGSINPRLATSGSVTIKPFNDRFYHTTVRTGWFSFNQNNQTMSGLTIGKPENTSDIAYNTSDLTINGGVSLYGSAITLTEALTATNSDINLFASGAVTQSAALTANRLNLNGTGTFTLQNTANNVGTIAGGDATTRLGNVAYRDANALEIGSVNTDGIFSSGTILIETETENLTLSEHINTTSNSDDAIILNAGKTAAAGTAAGGDIIVSGTPTLTYGSGGRAKLFSGSASNSTGLTTLVGGDANVRTGVDETTVAFNPVLTDDNAYALYRNVNYTFDGTTWSPSDPNGVSTINSDIEIMSGNAVINASTSCNTMLVHAGAGLTVNAAATLTVTNGLTLASNSTSYASLILDGTISGTMTYKRHVNAFTGSTGNDLIAPPLTGEAFNDFATANPNIYENPNDTNQKLFGPFDKTTGTYLNYNSTDTNTFAAGVGYRAARDASEDATHGTTFDFTGTAENASVAINIDNSGPQFEIWNLIGNPYPSYLDVQGFLNHEVASGITNIDLFASGSKAIYGYDGDASDGWTIYNLANTTANTLITPGQGFFVSADPTLVNTHDVEFTPAMRSTGTTDDFIAGRNSDLVYLKLNLSTNHNSYTTDFYFNANASEGLDEGYDASIWSGIPPSFSVYSQLVQDNTGQAIALQALHTSHLDDTSIPLGVNANQGEAITFTISDYALPESVNVYLEDLALSTVTLLNTADYSIVPTTNVLGTGRFFLRFTTHNLSTPTNQRHNLNIYALNASKEILISGIVYDATSVEIYDIQGRKIRTRLLDANSTENRMDVSTVSPGIYVVCVKNDRTQVLTKKVILH